jgi:tRNA(Ile)-lysidine synthase
MKQAQRIDWRACAARLAEAVPLARLHPSVLAWTQGRAAAARGPWAVACSGGSDSVALLLLLWAHWPARRERLVVLHFNHRLRGDDSREDALFCRRLSRALGLAYRSAAWGRSSPEGVSEALARTARHAFFRKTMAETGARALWLGHQADDIAESLFMRLARGSGTSGLAAPRPVQPHPGGLTHLRPLLNLGKAQLAALLSEAGAFWREDLSNATGAHFRNRIRHDVLPCWLAAAQDRDALTGLSLSREFLEEDDAALDAWLAELHPLRARVLDLTLLAGKPRALWRRALHLWLAATPYRGDLSRQGFESLLEAALSGRSTRRSLGHEGFAVFHQGLLRYRKTSAVSRRK